MYAPNCGVLAEVDDRHDVRMRDLARELGLLVEARPRRAVERERRGDDLQRERLAELEVASAIDLAHPALAQATVDRVPPTHRPFVHPPL